MLTYRTMSTEEEQAARWRTVEQHRDAKQRLAALQSEREFIAGQFREIAQAITSGGDLERFDFARLADGERIKGIVAEIGEKRALEVNLRGAVEGYGARSRGLSADILKSLRLRAVVAALFCVRSEQT